MNNYSKIGGLGKFFGLNISSKASLQLLNDNFFRKKETALPLKERMNFFLFAILNNENNIPISDLKSEVAYKYNIGNGNNSMMVRSIMKQRWWWNQ